MDQKREYKYPFVRKYWWIPVIVLFSGCVMFYGAMAWREVRYEAKASSMTFGDVKEGMFEDCIRVKGKVESATTVRISALESGIVEKKMVEEGESVKEGDVILVLKNPGLRQQILDSESQLAERQNMLRDTEIAMEKERLQLKRDILAARTEKNRKERLAGQKKTLYDENLCSKEDYLTASEDLQLAKESLKLLENRLTQDSIYRTVQLSMMRESLQNMRENFRLVRQRADNLEVRASYGGQLGRLNAELGQNISSGQEIGQINLLDNFKITVDIDEHYIEKIEKGLEGNAEKGDKKYGLTVSKIYPEVNGGTFKVDLDFKESLPDNIRVGQSYLVEIKTGDPVEAVLVPRGTFFQSSGGRYVYVVSEDGKRAEKREVRIGRQNPQYYEITEGLCPGERIITSQYTDFGKADIIMIK